MALSINNPSAEVALRRGFLATEVSEEIELDPKLEKCFGYKVEDVWLKNLVFEKDAASKAMSTFSLN